MGLVAAVIGDYGYAQATEPTTTTLPVSEVFGPTFQGEGPHAGRACKFLRLGLCNLACEWCDTPYTWDTTRYDVAAECPDTSVAEILARLYAIETPLVIVSGGEPLMHHRKLPELIYSAPQTWEWHLETNGTIPPPVWVPHLITHTTVSPKVATADPEKKRLKPRALEAWTHLAHAGEAAFKFVVRDPSDLAAVDRVVGTYDIPLEAVWVMPEGVTSDAVLATHRAIADSVLERGYSTTTRLHTLLWGAERGH